MLVVAPNPNSSVVDSIERLLCSPGGTRAIKLGLTGSLRTSSKWSFSHLPDSPMRGLGPCSWPGGYWSSTGSVTSPPSDPLGTWIPPSRASSS
ncbi:hypothetical protein D9M68_333080 [compost metagenome]